MFRPKLEYERREPPAPRPPLPPPDVMGCALLVAFIVCVLAATWGVLLQISGSTDRELGRWIGIPGAIGALALPVAILRRS